MLRDVWRLVTHRIQEVLVVRHDQYGMLVFLQVIIQPNDGVQVQVIRRLVEHQQNRLHEERPRQGDAHAPAAGKQLRGPLASPARSPARTGSARHRQRRRRATAPMALSSSPTTRNRSVASAWAAPAGVSSFFVNETSSAINAVRSTSAFRTASTAVVSSACRPPAPRAKHCTRSGTRKSRRDHLQERRLPAAVRADDAVPPPVRN